GWGRVGGKVPGDLGSLGLVGVAQGGGGFIGAGLPCNGGSSGVYVSAISGFEIGIKVQKGKLRLPAQPAEWFAAVLAHHDIEVLPLGLDVCLRSTELPAIHTDPCDRMIIAAAQVHHFPVVTTDPIFLRYGIKVIS